MKTLATLRSKLYERSDNLMTTELEHLARAPIDEVACGVIFPVLEALDPLLVGSYWHQRSSEYPGHSLRTPLRNAANTDAIMQLMGAVPPLRSMLVSKDDQFVIQVQSDRFYLNWRRRGDGYPRFNKRGERDGLLHVTLAEWERFAEFCELAPLNTKLEPTAIELAKIDVLREGVFWNELRELAELLPCIRTFVGFGATDKLSFGVRFTDPRDSGPVSINIALGTDRSTGKRVLTLETRMLRHLDGAPMIDAFRTANAELNAVFASLIPREQRARAFATGVEP